VGSENIFVQACYYLRFTYTHTHSLFFTHTLLLSTRHRCIADENLLNAVRESVAYGDRHTEETTAPARMAISQDTNSRIHILDARPQKAAVGNAIMGKGYEYTKFYTKCSLEFLNIENIHAVRSSMHELALVLMMEGQWRDLHDLVSDAHVNETKLESSRWFHHVRLIIRGACRAVELMDTFKSSVLIHCSDGWDRTAQLSSLAQMIMDPFYRTSYGFAILIEKEWLGFGHKFATRHGHPSVSADALRLHKHTTTTDIDELDAAAADAKASKGHADDPYQQSPGMCEYVCMCVWACE
jgi:hypothetical protein